jgi:hypothetical protein
MEVNAQQWREVVNQAEADKAAAGTKAQNKLASMHGAATPAVLSRAQHVVELLGSGAFGGPDIGSEAWSAIEQAGLHNNPALVTALANIANRMSEGPYHQPDDYSAGTQTPQDIDKRINELQAKQAGYLEGSRLSDAENKLLDELYVAKQRFLDSRRMVGV